MPTILPLVNIFSESLEIWSHRNATQDEMMEFYKKDGIFKHFVNDKLISKIESYLDAAKYVAEYVGDNTIESFINKQLDNDKNYYAWKKAMPSRTPTVLSDYQQKYPNYDRDSLNNAINELNCVLSVGQFLFHGGLWNSSNLEMTAVSPLSTSFDPRLAYMETIHNGKAYDRERIDLFVIRVKESKTSVFAYKRKGTNLGHENEVIFSSGLKLELKSDTFIINTKVTKCIEGMREVEKIVPVHVLEVDCS